MNLIKNNNKFVKYNGKMLKLPEEPIAPRISWREDEMGQYIYVDYCDPRADGVNFLNNGRFLEYVDRGAFSNPLMLHASAEDGYFHITAVGQRMDEDDWFRDFTPVSNELVIPFRGDL